MDSELIRNFLVPRNCSHVYGARYCILSIGRYGGFYIKIVFLSSSVHECSLQSFDDHLSKRKRINPLIILIQFKKF